MKKITCLIMMACSFMFQGTSSAAVVVTVGNVYGSNTNLDVSIKGSGTIAGGLIKTIWRIPDGSAPIGPDNPLVYDVNLFAGIASGAVGEYTTSAYNYYAHKLTTPITIFNTTKSTTEEIEYLVFNHNTGTGNDSFNLVFIHSGTFFSLNDEWEISGVSLLPLGKADSSVLTRGSYSYSDPSVGDMTLILRESTAIIPEASTAMSFVLGVMLLLVAGRRKIIQKVS